MFSLEVVIALVLVLLQYTLNRKALYGGLINLEESRRRQKAKRAPIPHKRNGYAILKPTSPLLALAESLTP